MRIVMTTLALSLLLVAGCKRPAETQGDTSRAADQATATPTATVKLENRPIKVGDLVVARWMGHSFYEGKAKLLTAQRVTVAWSDGSRPTEVDRTDVMLVPLPGGKPTVKEGDLVLAKWTGTVTNQWYSAEVIAVDEGVVKVRYLLDGVRENLDPSKVIVPPPPIRADLSDQAKQLELLEGAMAAGKPRQPADWKPQKGSRVVAMWAGLGWFSGTIAAVREGDLSVAWDDGTGEGKAPMGKVAPEPTADDPLPDKGAYVVVRPEIQEQVWLYGQVTGIAGKKIQVQLVNGETRELWAKDVLPFE